MKALLFLLLSACAQAKPTPIEQPMNLLHGPFVEEKYFPNRETHTFKLTADGKYWRHIIRRGSIVEERVFPVVPFRTNPSSK